MAIIASESQWGKGANATKQKNPLSVMGAGTIHDSAFPTIDKGLEAGAKNLNELYISKGLTTPEKSDRSTHQQREQRMIQQV